MLEIRHLSQNPLSVKLATGFLFKIPSEDVDLSSLKIQRKPSGQLQTLSVLQHSPEAAS